MSECPQVPLLSELIDDELSAGARDALLEHLEGCAECRRQLEKLRSLRLGLLTLPADPSARRRVRRRIWGAVDRNPRSVEVPWPVAAGLLLLLAGSLASNAYQAVSGPGGFRPSPAAELRPVLEQESADEFAVFSIRSDQYRFKATPVIHAAEPLLDPQVEKENQR